VNTPCIGFFIGCWFVVQRLISPAGTEGPPPVSSQICDRPLQLRLKAPLPLVRASVAITDEADSGTENSARPQRNTTYRPCSWNNRHKPFNLLSFSLACTTYMHC